MSALPQLDPPEISPLPALTQYRQRFAKAERGFQRLDEHDGRLARLRTLLAVLGVVTLYLWNSGALAAAWLLAPALAFVVAVLLHQRVAEQRRVAQRRCAYYERGIARLNDEWSGHGATGARYLDPEHEYAADLDLFGVGSLFQLLNGARTQLGEDRLAHWLCHAAERAEILERQGAVARLKNAVDLREQLALLNVSRSEVPEETVAQTQGDPFDANALRRWSMQPPQSIGQGARLVALAISASTVLAGLGAIFLGWGFSPLLLLLAVALVYLLIFKSKMLATMKGVNEAGKDLDALSQVLEVMQRQSFADPFLDRIVGQIRFEGVPPSQQVARLSKYIRYLNDSTRNQLFMPIGIALCLPLHLVHAIESWRACVGQAIPAWLTAVGDFEAAISLSRYAFERPDDPFPTIVAGPSTLSASALGHPLLKASLCVRNDIVLGGEQRMLMVSGSNMSGKSTLLRALGINCVLAQMGAPVCAQTMTLSLFRVATAMRVSDSLQQGQSLFFAVLHRLKRVVDLTETQTVLFLLDEILQGTNSHDRQIGAEAVIRSLLKQDALGLVTTHDLALTKIAGALPNVKNFHFVDQIEEGKMTFDYQLRPGTVEKSNAIELMRLVGLEV